MFDRVGREQGNANMRNFWVQWCNYLSRMALLGYPINVFSLLQDVRSNSYYKKINCLIKINRYITNICILCY